MSHWFGHEFFDKVEMKKPDGKTGEDCEAKNYLEDSGIDSVSDSPDK